MTTEKTVYLSQLILNPRNKEMQRDLADCQKLHCRIMSGFPNGISAEEIVRLRVLYRIDNHRQNNQLLALVQSTLEPDWSQLPERYLLKPAVSKPMSALYAGLQAGQRFVFRLRANPTKRLPLLIENRTGKERGKRIELRREEDQLDWLRRKSEQHGFRLLAARVNPNVLNARANPEGKVIGWRERSQPPMKFGSVLFEGELEITRAEDFKGALMNGIGSGKAYGFGLLSIAPAR
jgi:CRISPR system Cascade subunit CasE